MSELINITEIVPAKSNIAPVAAALAAGVEAGSLSAAEFHVKAKFMIEALNKAMKDTNDSLLTEVGTARDFTCLGAKLEPTETGTKYDYAQDATWAQIRAQIEPLEAKLKEQEERIKMATKIGHGVTDMETGEVLASPVVKTSTSSVKITLSK